eukprot:m.153037 g.153037  ORF g.153037 m.153037 type:complete len:406 (+) comp15063_c0_seq2:3752-4969(+)
MNSKICATKHGSILSAHAYSSDLVIVLHTSGNLSLCRIEDSKKFESKSKFTVSRHLLSLKSMLKARNSLQQKIMQYDTALKNVSSAIYATSKLMAPTSWKCTVQPVVKFAGTTWDPAVRITIQTLDNYTFNTKCLIVVKVDSHYNFSGGNIRSDLSHCYSFCLPHQNKQILQQDILINLEMSLRPLVVSCAFLFIGGKSKDISDMPQECAPIVLDSFCFEGLSWIIPNLELLTCGLNTLVGLDQELHSLDMRRAVMHLPQELGSARGGRDLFKIFGGGHRKGTSFQITLPNGLLLKVSLFIEENQLHVECQHSVVVRAFQRAAGVWLKSLGNFQKGHNFVHLKRSQHSNLAEIEVRNLHKIFNGFCNLSYPLNKGIRSQTGHELPIGNQNFRPASLNINQFFYGV